MKQGRGEIHRWTFDENHIEIRDFVLEFVQKNHRFPTLTEISKGTNKTIKTVSKHIKSLSFDSLLKKYKILTEDVALSIFRSAIKGNVGAQKLWLQVVENWTEKQDVNISGKISFAEYLAQKLKKEND